MSNVKKNKSLGESAKVNAMLSLKPDTDELMKKLRYLQHESIKLEERVTTVDHECDVLKEILSCSSKEDVQRITEEFLPHRQKVSEISSKEKDSLINLVYPLKSYIAQRHLGASVRRTDKGNLVVEFSPPNYELANIYLVKLEKIENIYKLNHFILPPIVPVVNLEEKYLSNTESQDVPAFINSVQQYLWCYWRRDEEVQNMKNENALKESIIYHNKARTVISFTLSFLGKYVIEISLRYDDLSCIPYSVQYLERDDKVLPFELKDALDDLKVSLLSHPVSEVLHVNLASDEESTTVKKADEQSLSSESTIIFELFK